MGSRLSSEPAVPTHLRPSAPTAAAAILCGDPARALAIAQRVLVKPRMSNHHRGLWGYHGQTPAGLELTVQATGIGGPSAAVVVGELATLGLRRAIRVGTCSARGTAPGLGSTLIVEAAIACDGTSRSLGFAPGAVIQPDPWLTGELLRRNGSPPLAVRSHDIHGADVPARQPPPSNTTEEDPPPVADLQTAALFALARRSGIQIAATLAVAHSDGRRLEDEPLERALLTLADASAGALSA